MKAPGVKPTTSGPAFRVTILGQQQAESYVHVYAHIDPERGVVHVLSADAQTHFLTLPIGSTLIEWQDPSVLEPQPRLPPFGSRALERLGEQVHRMTEGMGRGFGER